MSLTPQEIIEIIEIIEVENIKELFGDKPASKKQKSVDTHKGLILPQRVEETREAKVETTEYYFTETD